MSYKIERYKAWPYRPAKDIFVEGQVIQLSIEGRKAFANRNYSGGRVHGFSYQCPDCVIVLVDGLKYPIRFNQVFWEPR